MHAVAPQRYRTDVLRTLCLAGPSVIEAVARRSGIKTGIVHGELVAAESAGLVVQCVATGRWSSSPAGRVVLGRLLSEEVAPDVRSDLGALTARLADLDAEVTEIETRWFLREHPAGSPAGAVALNDHSDPVHDAAVIEYLGCTHPDRITAIHAAALMVPRLKRYAGRMADAWRRIRLGDHAAVGDPEHDAYFDVWAEFLRDVRSVTG